MMLKTKAVNEREQETRESIIKSAARLFAEKGFGLTTVREIARDSGVNVAMIYYYFKTKEGLHQEIIEESFSHLYHLLSEGVNEDKGAEEKIYNIIKVYITFLYHHKDLHKIILRETISQSRHIEMIVKRYISKNFDMVHGIIEEGVREGVFRRQDTILSTLSLIGMILYYFTYEPIYTRLFSPDKRKTDLIEYLPNHIFNQFMKGVRR